MIQQAGDPKVCVCVCVCVFVLTFGTMIVDLSREDSNKLTTPRCVGRCWCLHVSLCV